MANTDGNCACSFRLLELPEVILFHVLSFVAGPTYRAQVICHTLAPLSSEASDTLIQHSRALWDAVLKGDYGAEITDGSSRRSSKRLKQEPLQRVRDAHRMVLENTNIAYFYLEELCNSIEHGGTKNRTSLSRSRLLQIMNEYGPHLRINGRTSTGGMFLVQCCRARHVKESQIVLCVKSLVEDFGAKVNVSTRESPSSSSTPLCVAAARGMPKVLQYLLNRGASTDLTCRDRFRLFSNPRKQVKCTNLTPLESAQLMRAEELNQGADERVLKDLNKCIRLLERHEAQELPRG